MQSFGQLVKRLQHSLYSFFPRLWSSNGPPRSSSTRRIDQCFSALNTIHLSDAVPVVVDIGAHRGFFASSWLDWQPQSRVICLEPQQLVFQKLAERFNSDHRVTCYPLAAGRSTGEGNLRVHEYTETTSFLEMTPQLAAAAPQLAIHEVGTERTAMVKLDEFEPLENLSISLLKIDVQGYELEVLRGAQYVLQRTQYVFVEVAFAPLYECAPLFVEVYQHLTENGFYLVSFMPHSLAGDRLLEGDMLFRNDRL